MSKVVTVGTRAGGVGEGGLPPIEVGGAGEGGLP